MERRRFLIVKRRVKGQPPLAGIFKGEQPLNSKSRPPAPIKNQQAISLRFFPGPYGSACVQHAEPSLAETKCIANDLLYRKISHCLVHSLLNFPGGGKHFSAKGPKPWRPSIYSIQKENASSSGSLYRKISYCSALRYFFYFACNDDQTVV